MLQPSPRTRSATGCRSSTASGPTAALKAARIARMAEEGGASALLVFPPAPFTLQQSPAIAAVEHFKRIADATSLPIIAFQPSAGDRPGAIRATRC